MERVAALHPFFVGPAVPADSIFGRGQLPNAAKGHVNFTRDSRSTFHASHARQQVEGATFRASASDGVGGPPRLQGVISPRFLTGAARTSELARNRGGSPTGSTRPHPEKPALLGVAPADEFIVIPPVNRLIGERGMTPEHRAPCVIIRRIEQVNLAQFFVSGGR